jgi:transcriptional regulator with XRE-family HTH domain
METHEQLRQARERCGITLEALQTRTGVPVQVLLALERGAYDALPTGLYGRHAVRAYARTVGLDGDAILGSIARLIPEPEDPLDGLARLRGIARRARPIETQVEPEQHWPAGDDDHLSFDWRPVLAVATDGAVLLVFAVALISLTVAAAGTSLAALAPVAAPAWIFLIGLVSAIYFALLGGIGHHTAGAGLRRRLRRGRPRGVTRHQHGTRAIASDRPSAGPSGMQRAGPVPVR